jgi:hypothetical protein
MRISNVKKRNYVFNVTGTVNIVKRKQKIYERESGGYKHHGI